MPPTADLASSAQAVPYFRVLYCCKPGLFSAGFSRLLETLADRVEVHSVEPHALGAGPRRIDLTLVDVDDVRQDISELLSVLTRQHGAPLVVLATSWDEQQRAMANAAGAAVYILKSSLEADVLRVLRRIIDPSHSIEIASDATPMASAKANAAGNKKTRSRAPTNPYGLTQAQLRVLGSLCQGQSNFSIAKALNLRVGTVKVHLSNIYRKLQVESRQQASQIGERLQDIQCMMDATLDRDTCPVEWLLPYMRHEWHRKGDLLFQQGEKATTLFYVQAGRIALSELGLEVHKGELFGEIGLLSPQKVRTSSARCATDTHLFLLTREHVRRLCLEKPEFAMYLGRLVASRVTMPRNHSDQTLQ